MPRVVIIDNFKRKNKRLIKKQSFGKRSVQLWNAERRQFCPICLSHKLDMFYQLEKEKSERKTSLRTYLLKKSFRKGLENSHVSRARRKYTFSFSRKTKLVQVDDFIFHRKTIVIIIHMRQKRT